MIVKRIRDKNIAQSKENIAVWVITCTTSGIQVMVHGELALFWSGKLKKKVQENFTWRICGAWKLVW